MSRTARRRLSFGMLGLVVAVPLVVQLIAAATDADARQPGDAHTGGELVAEVHALISRIDKIGADANVRLALRRLAQREPRAIDVLAEAYHPTFDERRDAEGWERWRVEAALRIIGLNARLMATLDPWLASEDETVRERARKSIFGERGAITDGQRRVLLGQLSDVRSPAAMQSVHLRRMLLGDPGLLPAAPLLRDLLRDADPDVHLAGFGSLVEIAGRYSMHVRELRQRLAADVAPLLPAVAERLDGGMRYPIVSRILVDAGEAGQALALEHAADRASLAQRLTLAQHLASSVWFNDIRRGADRAWFDDLAAALVVPVLEGDSAAQKQVAMAIVVRLRLVPGPMIDPMIRLMDDADPAVRREALQRLLRADVRRPAFVSRVTEAMQGDDRELAAQTFQAVMQRWAPFEPEYVGAAVALIHHRDRIRRYHAVSLLADCVPHDAERVTAALAEALSDDFDDVLYRAADGLRNYRSRAAAHGAALEAALERHPDGPVAARLRAALSAIR